MTATAIEWAEHSWNPIVGCSVVSPGCTNCYAMRMAARLAAMDASGGHGLGHYAGLTAPSKAGPVWTGKVALNESALNAPLKRRKPTRWFVNSMGDLFHEAVPDAWIDRVFAVMALAPQHTFLVLTKRSARMRAWFGGFTATRLFAAMDAISREKWPAHNWPLPNVWLGVSVEDQARADERIPDLLATPAAVRWISAEPLLGPVDLTSVRQYNPRGLPWINALRGLVTHGDYLARSPSECSFNTRTQCSPPELPRLDWVVAGGESGKGARPMHPDWPRALRDQCAAAGVPFFFKQWGEWKPWPQMTLADVERQPARCTHNGVDYIKVGKHRAGRLLDGQLHDAFPEPLRASEPLREPAEAPA